MMYVRDNIKQVGHDGEINPDKVRQNTDTKRVGLKSLWRDFI